MSTYTEPPSRRTFRARRIAIVLTFGAVAGCVGLVHEGVASANALPSVYVTVDGNGTNPKVNWGEAWDACQKEAPYTRSVHYKGTWAARDESGDIRYAQEWDCDELP
jgi:hypothetical protein